MAATESKMLPLGTKAYEFELFNPVKGKFQTLNDLKSNKATVIAFICNHCPYVKFINKKLVEISNKYMAIGVSFIAINSNDTVKYPEDSPDNMIKTALENSYNFPYLFDETQEVAKSYMAACTPDFYIFDNLMKLVYRGQFDKSRPNNGIPVTGEDIINALDAILEGKPINDEQIPSIGCNIKWK